MASVLAFDKREVLDAMRAQRSRTLAMLEDLAESHWDTAALPGWRVRDVVAHLVSTDEAALTGRLLALGARRISIEQLESWNDEQVLRWCDRPVPALLHGLDVWGRRLVRALGAAPRRIAAARVPSPFGPVSLLWMGMLRVYDEWVHGEDVRRALGLPADDGPDAVRPAARQLLAAIPVQTLPRVAPGASGRLRLVLSDVGLPPLGIDLAARRYGLDPSGDGTAIEAPAGRLIMAAAGRDAWRDLETSGALVIRGDRAPAETFLDALLVV